MKTSTSSRFLNLVLALSVAFSLPINTASAQQQLSLPLNDQLAFPFMSNVGDSGMDLAPPPESGIQKISMRAMDASAGDAEELAAAAQKLSGSEIVSVTEVLPDDQAAIPTSFYERSARIRNHIRTQGQKQIKVSASQFKDWFVKNRVRITIIAFEVTVMTGLKFTELMISPVPIPYASAFAASLLLGSVLGTVEWNMPKLLKFIGKPGSLVNGMIERITGGANASARNLKSRKLLQTTVQFAKNTEVNFALFGVFKILLFATTQADGSFFHGIFESFQAITGSEVGGWAKLAVESTLVSFPTTKLILNQHAKNLAEAGDDKAKIARVNLRTTFLMSSALTARAILFSSVIVAGALHWPVLAVTAYAGLGVMFTGSAAKLWVDARRARIFQCSKLFETAL